MQNLKESDHLEDPDVDGRETNIEEIRFEGADWFNLAQNRAQWRAEIKHWVPCRIRNILAR